VFSHVFIGVGDFERAFSFYSAVMRSLGVELRFCEPEKPWAGWHSEGCSRPLFVIGKPYNEQPLDPGNGQMVAFAAKDRATVRESYDAALNHGGAWTVHRGCDRTITQTTTAPTFLFAANM
jgi:catechol 2,3-dioxygenase-like lactoylglutathione lyase family enzyme